MLNFTIGYVVGMIMTFFVLAFFMGAGGGRRVM